MLTFESLVIKLFHHNITIFIYYQEVRIKIKGIEDFIKDYRDLVEGNNIPIIKKTGNLIIKEQDTKIKVY